jgi:hypothetical protein
MAVSFQAIEDVPGLCGNKKYCTVRSKFFGEKVLDNLIVA